MFNFGWLRASTVGVKPRPHRQQCPSNIVECYKLNDSFDNVECCFDKVERSFYNVACCFDIVAGVDGALMSSFCSVAATLGPTTD